MLREQRQKYPFLFCLLILISLQCADIVAHGFDLILYDGNGDWRVLEGNSSI
jgi:hypothetical protein